MKQKQSLWVFLPLVGFVALALLLASGLGKDPQILPSALVGKPVPAFSLPSLLTEEVYDESLLTGQWQLLNVWGSWCPTCYVEHPYLLDLAASGVPIVGLNYKDREEDALRYITRLHNPYTHIIVDEDGQYGLDLGVYGAPETYLINPEGEVVLRHAGDLNERVWRNKFAPILAQAEEIAP